MPNSRQALRAARSAITGSKRIQCGLAAWKSLSQYRPFLESNHIASYLDIDGEFPTHWLNQQIIKSGKSLYLPLLTSRPQNHLEFQRYDKLTRFRKNRFGIPEPLREPRNQIPALQLDLVITPLVGFDTRGSRIGMGGGFYDRTFALLNKDAAPYSTHLIGLGFTVQQLEKIDRQPWDVPLNTALTERGIVEFSYRLL